jgi:hypothetical protein
MANQGGLLAGGTFGVVLTTTWGAAQQIATQRGMFLATRRITRDDVLPFFTFLHAGPI